MLVLETNPTSFGAVDLKYRLIPSSAACLTLPAADGHSLAPSLFQQLMVHHLLISTCCFLTCKEHTSSFLSGPVTALLTTQPSEKILVVGWGHSPGGTFSSPLRTRSSVSAYPDHLSSVRKDRAHFVFFSFFKNTHPWLVSRWRTTYILYLCVLVNISDFLYVFP